MKISPMTKRPFDQDEMLLWRGLEAAVMRRDMFWTYYYADQLSTYWREKGVFVQKKNDTIDW